VMSWPSLAVMRLEHLLEPPWRKETDPGLAALAFLDRAARHAI
jgi:hypothetical protein